MERAHSTSHQGLGFKTKGSQEDNDLLSVISRVESQQSSSDRDGFLAPESNPRRYQRAQSHCPAADIRSLQKSASRNHRESMNSLNTSASKLYPTTQRRCSEAVAAYAATGDLEVARSLLLEARERSLNRSIVEGILKYNVVVPVVCLGFFGNVNILHDRIRIKRVCGN